MVKSLHDYSGIVFIVIIMGGYTNGRQINFQARYMFLNFVLLVEKSILRVFTSLYNIYYDISSEELHC